MLGDEYIKEIFSNIVGETPEEPPAKKKNPVIQKIKKTIGISILALILIAAFCALLILLVGIDGGKLL